MVVYKSLSRNSDSNRNGNSNSNSKKDPGQLPKIVKVGETLDLRRSKIGDWGRGSSFFGSEDRRSEGVLRSSEPKSVDEGGFFEDEGSWKNFPHLRPPPPIGCQPLARMPVYVYVCICMYVCMYVCIYIYIYMYIYIEREI